MIDKSIQFIILPRFPDFGESLDYRKNILVHYLASLGIPGEGGEGWDHEIFAALLFISRFSPMILKRASAPIFPMRKELVVSASPTDRSLAPVRVWRMAGAAVTVESDVLAVEEPLEIRIGYDRDGQRHKQSVSITMRTPGHDRELAAGFLFTEGLLTHPEQIADIHACGQGNVVRVDLQSGVAVDLARLERHFYTSSSCGVCGKTSLEAVRSCTTTRCQPGQPVVDVNVLYRLPEMLRGAQAVFDRTGGLHASALFDTQGQLLAVREDVGRHNALDKLIGHQFLKGRTPLTHDLLLVSGRVSFELVQKAAMAGIPILAAIGAPSSLAVELARELGLTIVGFLRPDRCNVYCGAERIAEVVAEPSRSLPLVRPAFPPLLTSS